MRVTVFRVAERKSPKKRRPPICDPFASLRGKPAAGRLRGAPWNSLCASRAAQTATASQFTKHAREGAHATPRPARPRRIQKGTRESDIHTGHRCARPPLAGASATRCAGGAERSNGPWGCSAVGCSAAHPLLAAPAAGRLRGGTRVVARVLRALTRRGCPSGARSAKRVPRCTPQPPRRRFAPSHSEGVADWGSPFFWVLFFGEAKNKYLGRRAENRPPPSTRTSNQPNPAPKPIG